MIHQESSPAYWNKLEKPRRKLAYIIIVTMAMLYLAGCVPLPEQSGVHGIEENVEQLVEQDLAEIPRTSDTHVPEATATMPPHEDLRPLLHYCLGIDFTVIDTADAIIKQISLDPNETLVSAETNDGIVVKKRSQLNSTTLIVPSDSIVCVTQEIGDLSDRLREGHKRMKSLQNQGIEEAIGIGVLPMTD
jgi:hypothetical protein